MAMEGRPVQEIAAIEVNRHSLAIMDVFHGFAHTEEDDSVGRNHIHGLNVNYLKLFGQTCKENLLFAFSSWIYRKSFTCVFMNEPKYESQLFGFYVYEFRLAPWTVRKNQPSHQLAKRYKEQSIPICSKTCPKIAHSSFVTPAPTRNVTEFNVKADYGYSCALYSAMELYFEYVMT